jgi:hypothetical protein
MRDDINQRSEEQPQPAGPPAAYTSSVDIERMLGDPFEPTNVMSYKRSVELDERE